jgi:hypothetical protein
MPPSSRAQHTGRPRASLLVRVGCQPVLPRALTASTLARHGGLTALTTRGQSLILSDCVLRLCHKSGVQDGLERWPAMPVPRLTPPQKSLPPLLMQSPGRRNLLGRIDMEQLWIPHVLQLLRCFIRRLEETLRKEVPCGGLGGVAELLMSPLSERRAMEWSSPSLGLRVSNHSAPRSTTVKHLPAEKSHGKALTLREEDLSQSAR